MSEPAAFDAKSFLRTLTHRPGVYGMLNEKHKVIYVGKAKSLRSRLGNYFQNPRNLATRTRQMVESAESVEWIQVGSGRDAADFAIIEELSGDDVVDTGLLDAREQA